MPNSMLEPYRVVDLTDGRADLAGFVLAGLGADVIKVEPPGGSPARFEGPFASDEPAGSASLSFQAELNQRLELASAKVWKAPEAVPM